MLRSLRDKINLFSGEVYQHVKHRKVTYRWPFIFQGDLFKKSAGSSPRLMMKIYNVQAEYKTESEYNALMLERL